MNDASHVGWVGSRPVRYDAGNPIAGRLRPGQAASSLGWHRPYRESLETAPAGARRPPPRRLGRTSAGTEPPDPWEAALRAVESAARSDGDARPDYAPWQAALRAVESAARSGDVRLTRAFDVARWQAALRATETAARSHVVADACLERLQTALGAALAFASGPAAAPVVGEWLADGPAVGAEDQEERARSERHSARRRRAAARAPVAHARRSERTRPERTPSARDGADGPGAGARDRAGHLATVLSFILSGVGAVRWALIGLFQEDIAVDFIYIAPVVLLVMTVFSMLVYRATFFVTRPVVKWISKGLGPSNRRRLGWTLVTAGGCAATIAGGRPKFSTKRPGGTCFRPCRSSEP